MIRALVTIGAVMILAIVGACLPGEGRVCPLCDGEREREVDGETVRCVICSGKGVLK